MLNAMLDTVWTMLRYVETLGRYVGRYRDHVEPYVGRYPGPCMLKNAMLDTIRGYVERYVGRYGHLVGRHRANTNIYIYICMYISVCVFFRFDFRWTPYVLGNTPVDTSPPQE